MTNPLDSLKSWAEKQVSSAEKRVGEELSKVSSAVGNVGDAAATTINKAGSTIDSAGNIIDQATQIVNETDLLAYKKKLEQEAYNSDFKIFGSLWTALAVLPPSMLAGFKPKSKGVWIAGGLGSTVPIYICAKYIYESKAETGVKLGFGLPVAAAAASLGFIFGRVIRTKAKLNGRRK